MSLMFFFIYLDRLTCICGHITVSCIKILIMKGVNQKFFLMFFIVLNLLLFACTLSAQGTGHIVSNVGTHPQTKGITVLTPTATAPQTKQFSLPDFGLSNARYYWVYNGDDTGYFQFLYIESNGRQVKVQTQYSTQVFPTGSQTVFGQTATFNFTNNDADLKLEFDIPSGAMLYLNFTEGKDVKTTFAEWYPQIYDFVENLKRP